jgi:SET family sugar efflux transporter-like MFS transporter
VVRNYWLLLLVVCTLTATASALLAQGFAYARDVLAGDPAAPLMTSALRTCFSLAWVAGPPLASLLLDSGGFRLLYGSASAIYALVLLVVVFWLRDPVRLAAQDAHDAARQEAPRDAPARSLWLTIAALVLLQGAIGLNVQLVPLLVKANLHSDVRAAGVVLGVCAALEVPAMLGFGALSTRVPLRRLVLLGPLFGGVYYAIAAASAAVWQLGAAQVINACFIAIAQGLAISYVQELLPSRPGRASTLYSNTFAYGLMLASPLVGLGARYGYRMTYVAAVGLSAGGLGLLLAGRPRLPTATGDTPSREGVHTAAQPGA